ncbi:unnamed protein product [Lupinus luteus]|uniref:Uncharacterized protein n=1 Tax=Lupinus luteus TaxID=3873 RepID=A0AAV1VQX6_LUPLU
MATQISQHLEPWHNLNGKVVMVTGASSGLGTEFCLNLARAGCRIIAAARRIDRLKSLCQEINRTTTFNDVSAGSLRAVAVELDGPTINKCLQKAWDAFGHIDVLINNAGVRGSVKSSLELSEEEWNHMLRTNLTGRWFVSKYVSIRMRDAQQKGTIINISSIDGLNRIMALELGKHKISVNSISLGLFKSEITDKLMQKE